MTVNEDVELGVLSGSRERSRLPRAITNERLRHAVEDQTFIKGGVANSAEGLKYDFHLGSQILKASFGGPINAEGLPETEKAKLVIAPGEMVFAFTQERLALPATVMALLSPKRKMSHAGILVIGGFCIDPNYEGPLMLGLFNFSSTPFRLVPGRKVIAATFYELDETEQGEFPHPERFEEFPLELIEVMQKYQPSSVPALSESLAKLRDEVERIRTDMASHEQWYQRFEGSLQRHDNQIGDLLQGLASEKDTRSRGEDKVSLAQEKISDALHKLEGTLSWIKGAAVVVGGALTLIVIPVLINFITAWLNKP